MEDLEIRSARLSWVRADTPSTYRADLFNTVDMLALHLLLATEIAYYAAPRAYLPLRSFAVLTLCAVPENHGRSDGVESWLP